MLVFVFVVVVIVFVVFVVVFVVVVFVVFVATACRLFVPWCTRLSRDDLSDPSDKREQMRGQGQGSHNE